MKRHRDRFGKVVKRKEFEARKREAEVEREAARTKGQMYDSQR